MFSMHLYGSIQPFWFWNGDMREEEIRRQLREMKDKGVGGFFLHPRQGLTIPYLGESWFERVETAVREAAALGLAVWLYDEFPYPSGNAGGLILARRPELAVRMLEPVVVEIEGPRRVCVDIPLGRVVSARLHAGWEGEPDISTGRDVRDAVGIVSDEWLYQETGLTKYNRKRFFSKNGALRAEIDVPRGRWRLFVFVERVLEDQKYFGRFADPLNPETTELFVALTHEPYRSRLGRWFGSTIVGFFSDEVEPLPHGSALKWSPLLPAFFEKRNGYRLEDCLEALIAPIGAQSCAVRRDYAATVADMFEAAWDVPISAWCARHGLLYAAEKPVLRSAQLRHIHVPGIDAAHRRVFDGPELPGAKGRANAALAASAARFNGSAGVLCECFHSIGWGMTLEDARWLMDLLALQGVDLFVPHAFYYTSDSLAKHDAPPSLFTQTPAWRHFGLLTRHADALVAALRSGARCVDILLVDPTESLHMAADCPHPAVKSLAETWGALQSEFLLTHLDFDIAGQELLAEAVVGERFEIRSFAYRAVVVPPLLVLEEAARSRLVQFAAAGGLVVCLERPPLFTGVADGAATGSPAAPRGLPACELPGCRVVGDAAAAAALIEERGLRRLSVKEGSVECRSLAAVLREPDGGVFVVNLSRRTINARLELRADRPAAADVELAPCESKFIRIAGAPVAPAEPVRAPQSRRVVVNRDSELALRLLAPNALRLGRWNLRLSTRDGREADGGRVSCAPIVNQLEEAAIAFTPRYRRAFGCSARLELPDMDCRYASEFVVEELPAQCLLAAEPGSLLGEWNVFVNGVELARDRFSACGSFWSPGLSGADVAGLLRQGRNSVEVRLAASSPAHGLVNPLYLLGDFGVFPAGDWTVRKAPARAFFGRLAEAGLPFYAGELDYLLDLGAGEALELEICDCHDPVELLMDGREEWKAAEVRAWPPYRWTIPAAQSPRRCVLRVATTLLGLFEGMRADEQGGGYLPLDESRPAAAPTG